ncbi:MAG: c-type cytochrome [Acidobacteria bacterium]|nr:c-type cytochrome [Acidobacteriota bacterium]MCZ6769990.1 c-type cytochrome [Acidobacteriota bacterium]
MEVFLLVKVVAGLTLLSGVLALGQGGLPKGPGEALAFAKCSTCHGVGYLKELAGSPYWSWDRTLLEMERMGLQVSPEERKIILDYLVTYLGPDPLSSPTPPDSPPSPTPQVPAKTSDVDGAQLFANYCNSCHPDGRPGNQAGSPPLAGNAFLARDPVYAVLVLLNGLQGPIEVDGQSYSGMMPPWSYLLSDKEIAALDSHIRMNWGNQELLPQDFRPVTVEEVAQARSKTFTAQQVWEYRKKLESAGE